MFTCEKSEDTNGNRRQIGDKTALGQGCVWRPV